MAEWSNALPWKGSYVQTYMGSNPILTLRLIMNIDKIRKRLEKFTKDRDWEQFHSPKNLSMALSVEVAELVEIFQWSNSGGLDEITDPKKREKIKEEIADIFIYLIKISSKLDFDLDVIINEKIDRNEKKYPIEKSKGKSLKYNELDE